MNEHYNQNYSKDEIAQILNKIQNCIIENRFTVSQNLNRQENIDFIINYNLSGNRIKSILLQIKTEDFCHSLQNTNLGYEHELLYVFVPQIQVFSFSDNEETVDLYTKFNVINRPNGNNVIVISFHKCNKAISYLFR